MLPTLGADRIAALRAHADRPGDPLQLAAKVLLACAKAYWDRYMGEEVTTTEKNKIKNFKLAEATDIYAFFDTEVVDEVEGVKVRMMPNDFARPAYGVVASHVQELLKVQMKEFGNEPVKPNVSGEYAFYDLWLVLRALQRKETRIRMDHLPAVVKFNEVVAIPPEFDDIQDGDERMSRTLAHCNAKLHARNANPLTKEEFFAVCAFETRLRHPRQKGKDGKYVTLATFDSEPAKAVLRRFGFLKAKA